MFLSTHGCLLLILKFTATWCLSTLIFKSPCRTMRTTKMSADYDEAHVPRSAASCTDRYDPTPRINPCNVWCVEFGLSLSGCADNYNLVSWIKAAWPGPALWLVSRRCRVRTCAALSACMHDGWRLVTWSDMNEWIDHNSSTPSCV